MIMNLLAFNFHLLYLRFLCIIVFLIFARTTNFAQSAQTIYYNNTNKIGIIDIETCDTTLLFEVPFPWGINDIAFTTDGGLVACIDQRIAKIDLINQTFTPLQVIGNYAFSVLTTDKAGRILIAGSSLLGEVDPETGAFTEIGPLPTGLSPQGDMTFYKGRLILTSRTSSPITHVLVEVNMEDPLASIVLTELIFPGDPIGFPHGLVTLLDNCENQRVIIVGSYQKLYELNMDDYSVIPLCEQPHGFTGAALLTEYLASACDLLIDLDFDNSSGAMGFDWQDSIRCMPFDSPLCDEDVYVHAEARIDSLTIWLEGTPPDGDREYLWFGGYPGLSSSVTAGPSITLVNEGDVSHADWEQAILGLRYRHDGPMYTGGLRQVAFLPHSAIRAGDTVRAMLNIPGDMPYAGRDTLVQRCRDSDEIMLYDLLSPNAMSGGSFLPSGAWWQPAISLDTALVAYIVTHPDCPADTALLTLIALEVPELDLGPDVDLCYGDSLALTLDANHTYLWQDGSADPSYLITSGGTYLVTATHSNGCTATARVVVAYSAPPSLEDEGLLQLCPGDQVSWHGQLIDEPGVYAHGIAGSGGCDSIRYLVEVQYDSQPDATLSGDTVLCEEGSVMLQVTPGYAYQWSHGPEGDVVEIAQPGLYQVTVSDGASACIRILEVEVLASPPIQLPDVVVEPPMCKDTDEGAITLGAATGGQPPLSVRLDGVPIAAHTTLVGYPPGEYLLTIEDALGCSKMEWITVPEAPIFELQVPAEVILEAGAVGTITASGTLSPPVQYTWQPSTLIVWQEENRVGVTATASGLLTLTAIDVHGCTYAATILLIVQDDIVLYIPTAFSPNDDGINDVWMPIPGGDKSYLISDLRIFDRWGNLLHASSGPAGETGWNGRAGAKRCDPGVYVYMFSLAGPSGETKVYSGEVQLLR
jgi:gliding motility-associated-like protein